MPVAVGPLLELQHHDSRGDRLRALARSLPEQAEVDRFSAELRRGEAALAQAAQKAAESRRTQDRLEAELAALESKASGVADRLYGRAGVVSSPKELQNLQADLDMLRRQKDALEERVLLAMEEREGAADLEKRTEEAVATLRDRLRQAQAACEEARRRVEDELRDVEATTARLRADVPPDVLSLYDRIREIGDGVAAAALSGGVCGGCQLRLSSAEYEAARHAHGIVRCEACRRILVLV